jgi:hypothetical protein
MRVNKHSYTTIEVRIINNFFDAMTNVCYFDFLQVWSVKNTMH